MSLEGKSQGEIAALAALADGLLTDARTRGPFQRMVKAVNPKVVLPEVEIEDRVAAALKPLQEQNAALVADREKDKQQAGANALYESLKDSGVVANRAEFNGLVMYAAGHGFQTNEAGLTLAGRHRAAEQELAEPTPATFGVSNLKIDAEKDKGLLSNPADWARQQATLAVNELAKARAGR